MTTQKDQIRAEISRQIAEFLASGKNIDQVDYTANHYHQQPIKRSRREQIDYAKRMRRSASKAAQSDARCQRN